MNETRTDSLSIIVLVYLACIVRVLRVQCVKKLSENNKKFHKKKTPTRGCLQVSLYIPKKCVQYSHDITIIFIYILIRHTACGRWQKSCV